MSLAVTHLIGFGARRAVGYSPPLDTVSGATGAFGLLKLRTAYASNCLKVRRSSDSTTQDIGFSGNALDTTSLLSFCGAGDGFVDTLYDQSGNGNNLTQSTAGNQPKIVSSGSLVANIGSQPTMNFDGSNDRLSRTTWFPLSSTAATIIGVARATAGGSSTSYNQVNPVLVANQSGVWEIGWQSTGGGSAPCVYNAAFSQGRMANASYTFPTNAVVAWRFSTSTSGHKLYVNGGTAATNTNTTSLGTSTSGVDVGSTASVYMTGDIGALILFDSELSTTNTNTIGSALATHFGTTWASI